MMADIASALLGTPGAALALALIALLVLKEISISAGERAMSYGRFLNFAIVPLFVVFAARVAVRVVQSI